MYLHMHTYDNAYRWLWMKYVTGFNPAQHCAPSLKGRNSKLITPGRQAAFTVYEGELNEYEAPYVYLCGVTSRLADNLHLVVSEKSGSIVTYRDRHCRITVYDACHHTIKELPQDLDIPGVKLTPHYTTCRNYQFGYHYFYNKDATHEP